jgi:excisionase family DNA binding protein
MRYTDFDQLPVVLSVEDLTEILCIGRNTAYDLVRSGKIKSIRVGNQIRITKSALREFLDQT